MLNKLPDLIHKGAQYLFTPLEYPGRLFFLAGLTITNRPLVRELVHLTEHRRWFETKNFQTVIDVGGYIGAFSLAVRTMLPAAQIYAFEPLPDNYQKLVNNLSASGRFKAFQTAIGDRCGDVDFFKSSFTPSSSILPMGELHKKTFPHTSQSTKITVPIARLDDFLSEMQLEPPVLLKLDVQGYEDKALMGALKILEHIDTVMTEISFSPLYEGQASFDELNAFMKEQGFEYTGGFDTLISPVDGSILQADALFIRESK